MKLKAGHFEVIETQINAVLAAEPGIVERYRRGDFPRAEKVRDINKRFRWDVLSMAPGMSRWLCETIYPYAHNDHIDTALRRIVPRIN
jgi:hypothetical protein